MASGKIIGGGPFESGIRILSQQNQDLATAAGLADHRRPDGRSRQETVLWVISSLLPEFGRFDFANHVSYGFNISGDLLVQSFCRAAAFVVPLFVAGYLPQDAGGGQMNPQRSFLRKVVYLAAIGALLGPLFWLSQPATSDVKEAKGRPGGLLAQLRQHYHISQTELGRVDLTSETIKLATLGMRGVAADILWAKAEKLPDEEGLTNFSATLEQITKLQPNFIGPWHYQAWNLSYNVAAAFDDYHDKYYWVIRGVKLPPGGHRHNEHEPRLSGTSAGSSPTRSALPTKRSNSAASSRRTTTSTAPDPWNSATTGWWARSGIARPRSWWTAGSRQEHEPGGVLAGADVPDGIRRGPGERTARSAKWPTEHGKRPPRTGTTTASRCLRTPEEPATMRTERPGGLAKRSRRSCSANWKRFSPACASRFIGRNWAALRPRNASA